MISQLFTRRRDLNLERSYSAPIGTVWEAWTHPEMLRKWWGVKKTTVEECEIDLRVGGRIYIVTEAGEGMGKYHGTRWPMEGTFSIVEENVRLMYEARSWTEGEEDTTTIEHVNDLTLSAAGDMTVVNLKVSITDIGPGAKMAAFGMKMGYKQHLANLAQVLQVAR